MKPFLQAIYRRGIIWIAANLFFFLMVIAMPSYCKSWIQGRSNRFALVSIVHFLILLTASICLFMLNGSIFGATIVRYRFHAIWESWISSLIISLIFLIANRLVLENRFHSLLFFEPLDIWSVISATISIKLFMIEPLGKNSSLNKKPLNFWSEALLIYRVSLAQALRNSLFISLGLSIVLAFLKVALFCLTAFTWKKMNNDQFASGFVNLLHGMSSNSIVSFFLDTVWSSWCLISLGMCLQQSISLIFFHPLDFSKLPADTSNPPPVSGNRSEDKCLQYLAAGLHFDELFDIIFKPQSAMFVKGTHTPLSKTVETLMSEYSRDSLIIAPADRFNPATISYFGESDHVLGSFFANMTLLSRCMAALELNRILSEKSSSPRRKLIFGDSKQSAVAVFSSCFTINAVAKQVQ
jgi:hypothetical protein